VSNQCDVSRGFDDRDRPFEGQVSEIRSESAYRRSGYRRSWAQRFCAFRNRDPRNPEGIETIHLRDRCRKSGASRHIADWDIGDPGHKGFVHFEIAIREIPMSGVQLSAQQRRRTED
jgi:hypothetical protein